MNELDFPVAEYQNRIQRIRQTMSEKKLDALIVLGAEAIHYVSGFDCAWTQSIGELSGVVIPLNGEPRLVARLLESKTIKKQWMNSRMYADWEGHSKVFKEALEECGVMRGRIGVEENVITVQKLERLKALVPEARIVNATGLVESAMAESSKLEIEFTRKAGQITQAGLEKAIKTVRQGIPLYEVITQGTEAMYEAGMTEQQMLGWYMLSVVWGGPDGGAPHETDVTRKIQKGDIITPQLRGTYKHYVSGATGSVYVGENPPSVIKEAFKVSREMYLSAREAMKPGVTFREVWQAANKVHRKAFGVNYDRMLGAQQGVGFVSGLGMSENILRSGMTYLVQALLSDPLCICVGASLMVTQDGCEEITKPLLELATV